jgi:glycosyltransferase involved in cell wall biosynthesis
MISLRKRLKKKLRFIIEHRFGVPIANSMDAFIFTTPMVRQLYMNFGFKGYKANTIPDFVDMNSVTKKYHVSEASIAAHQQHQDKIILFSTGRMIEEKGFDIIIRAFALVKNKSHYEVILSGDGPDRARLEKLVAELALEKYVSFAGWLDRSALDQLLLLAHIFIFPKWWIEYTSVLLMETFAFGLTDHKAATFTPDNHQEMTLCIEELGENEERRLEVALAMFARPHDLDFRILLKKMEAVILSTVKQ